MNCYEDLKWRGLVQDISSPDLIDKLNNDSLSFYIGTDPSADSMHIGHYSSFLICTRLAKAGHRPLLLVGGATGLIGDPKPNSERPLVSKEEIEKNAKGLTKQAKKIFGFEVVNNWDWTKDINICDFLRDYGKYFNVNYMLAKDHVKSRMDVGITYAEFSYMLLQAMDFYYLFKEYNCELQVAGSDQWGNITAGIELIRKKLDKQAYGMVMPLVTDSQGVKFGKTEGNALWIDENKTSSYELYQYLINLEDSMIVEYLKKLTFLSKEEIEEIAKENDAHPETRIAHKALAREIITHLHGEESYNEAVKISEALFSGDIKDFTKEEVEMAFKGLTPFEIDSDLNIVDLLVDNGVCSSKREAREFINNGSITINGDKVTDLEYTISKDKCIENTYIVIRRGKKKYFIGIYK